MQYPVSVFLFLIIFVHQTSKENRCSQPNPTAILQNSLTGICLYAENFHQCRLYLSEQDGARVAADAPIATTKVSARVWKAHQKRFGQLRDGIGFFSHKYRR